MLFRSLKVKKLNALADWRRSTKQTIQAVSPIAPALRALLLPPNQSRKMPPVVSHQHLLRFGRLAELPKGRRQIVPANRQSNLEVAHGSFLAASQFLGRDCQSGNRDEKHGATYPLWRPRQTHAICRRERALNCEGDGPTSSQRTGRSAQSDAGQNLSCYRSNDRTTPWEHRHDSESRRCQSLKSPFP